MGGEENMTVGCESVWLKVQSLKPARCKFGTYDLCDEGLLHAPSETAAHGHPQEDTPSITGHLQGQGALQRWECPEILVSL